MNELNLLPYRIYQRERQKKRIGIFIITLLLIIFLGCGYLKCYSFAAIAAPDEKKPIHVKRSIKLPNKIAYSLNDPNNISLNIETIRTHDALQLLIQSMHINAMLSPAISGSVSLHVQHMSAEKALDMLLVAQNLHLWRKNQVWFIAPNQEWLQYQKDDIERNTLLRESESVITRVFQIHYANAADIAKILQDNTASLLSKRGQVRVDVRTNILCVQDISDSMADISRLIRRLDVPVQKVLIKAQLASIDSDFEQTLGFQFTTQAPASSSVSLAIVKLPDYSILDMQLSALENAGHGELISKPSLLTANQKTASIEAGEEIPYQEIAPNGATSVTFKKAVLRLEVTPQVLPDDQVLLALRVNQDKPSARMVLGVPAITTRQMSTEILVKNGQTVVLGGIYETNDQHNLQQVPFLGKIPGIGWLFQQQSRVQTKRELLIFVTPQIIR